MSPQPSNERLYALVDKYLAGQASAAEAEELRAWISRSPENAMLLEDLRVIRQIASRRPPETNVDAAWSRAVDALRLHAADDPPSAKASPERARRGTAAKLAHVPARPRRHLLPALAVAATLVVLIGGLLWQAHVRIIADDEPGWRDYVTLPAQRANVRLRDGTQVMLAPSSQLRVVEGYGRSHREVHIEGEAYFEVKDVGLPFRVYTKGSMVEVLGTSFLVKQYANREETEVVVTNGRVKVGLAGDTVRHTEQVLEAGDRIRVNLVGEYALEHNVDVGHYVAWTRGEISFDRATLGEVVEVLERWYNVQILLADRTLGSLRLTASFRNEPLPQIIDRIALTLGLRAEQRGNVWIISAAQPESNVMEAPDAPR